MCLYIAHHVTLSAIVAHYATLSAIVAHYATLSAGVADIDKVKLILSFFPARVDAKVKVQASLLSLSHCSPTYCTVLPDRLLLLLISLACTGECQ